ncbi:MAG: O-methyltransferase [Candidatus Binataceae bacterium]
MSRDSLGLSEHLSHYLRSVGQREDDDLKHLREVTAHHKMATMQISPEQGQFMALLAELMGARRYLEVGTFTGYSAMWMAKAMGPHGHIVCLDVSEEYTAVAREHWAKAGIEGRIHLRLAPALKTLEVMLAGGEANSYDIAFIDADKVNYDGYYEAALKLVRTGGLIAIDNVLWSGAVADPEDNSTDTVALRALNKKLSHDDRITVSMLPIGDGLTLARKR